MDTTTGITKPDLRTISELFNDAADAIGDAKDFAIAVNLLAAGAHKDERCNAIQACMTEVLRAMKIAALAVDIGAEKCRPAVAGSDRKAGA